MNDKSDDQRTRSLSELQKEKTLLDARSKDIQSYAMPYDRQSVSVGIVHIGAGRFHRAHEALYCHELLEKGDLRWGICGAYILPNDRASVEALSRQQGVYTLVERDATGDNAKVIGSIVETVDGHRHPDTLIARLADSQVKIVTFTVTEAGYYYDPSNNQLLLDHESVINDINKDNAPRTLYGFIAAGLERRRSKGSGPVTLQSCDNVQGNGDLTRSLFFQFLKEWDRFNGSDLTNWVSDNTSFPNSMVDRITPAFEMSEVERAKKLFNCEDAVPVTSESFRQWIIEDQYCNESPDWASVGVQLVENVKPYEQMKIRFLNAGHSVIGYAGYLAGYRTIDAITNDSTIQGYLRRFFQEVEQSVGALPGIDIKAYQDKLIERFSNPAIVDQALRICKDGTAKIPGFLLPTLLELISKRLPTTSFSFFFASYYAFLSAQIEAEGISGVDDVKADYLVELVKRASGNMETFLADQTLFGYLGEQSNFIADVQKYYDAIEAKGVLKVLAESEMLQAG